MTRKNTAKKYKPKYHFDNKITISGKITKKDDFVNFIPYPVFGIEIENKRKLKDTEKPLFDGENYRINNHRAVIFNNESFINEFEVGDRILIHGEIQSRNQSRKHIISDDTVQNAVDLYQKLFNKLPTEEEPSQYFRQPIVWKKLMEYNLIDEIPTDSAIDKNQEVSITDKTPYIYKVDWNGEVSKETEQTYYEIIILSYKKLETKEVEEDRNKVTFLGRISTEPIFDIEGIVPSVKFSVQSYLNYFKDEKRFAFLPFEMHGLDAEDVFKDYKKNDFVKIKGSFDSKEIERTLRLKKKTSTGKTKKKKVVISELARYVTINKIEKQLKK